jgi:Raf kinase inhibitor-like YbhB/YbcL family protein
MVSFTQYFALVNYNENKHADSLTLFQGGYLMKTRFSFFTLTCGFLLAACTAAQPVAPTPTSSPTLPSTPTPSLTPTTPPTETPIPPTPTPAPLSLTSTAFSSGELIPEKYARHGGNISPELTWSDPPAGTKSFALLVVSGPMPDGGEHWVLWAAINIPPDIRSLPEGIEPDEDGNLPDGGQLLENSWVELKYGGPTANRLESRRFNFYIFALDEMLDLDYEAEKKAARAWYSYTEEILLKAIDGHILAKGHLKGKYTGKE